MPRCGFSAAAIECFKALGVPFETVDVLADPNFQQYPVIGFAIGSQVELSLEFQFPGVGSQVLQYWPYSWCPTWPKESHSRRAGQGRSWSLPHGSDTLRDAAGGTLPVTRSRARLECVGRTLRLV